MNFEPQKFFIGLIDFFSILMPGALVAYLGKEWATKLFGRLSFALQGAESWMIFLFAAYLLGHIAFLLGSLLDGPYDWFRSCTVLGQSQRLAMGKKSYYLSVRWLGFRALAQWVFGGSADAAIVPVVRIKSQTLTPLSASKAINAFQWCKARLSKEHSDGLVTVQRFEADSKFFRSFAVVLVALLLIHQFKPETLPTSAVDRRFFASAVAILLLLTIWRYIDQRFKATQQAYWFVITLEGTKSTSVPNSVSVPEQKAGKPTHAGGVVFRKRNGSVEYLLVESDDRKDLVLPKGHIELGESKREAAVREVHEETGHWASVVDWIDDARFGTSAHAPLVRVFLMELAEEGKDWPKEERQSQWLPLDKARKSFTFDETKELLNRAEEIRNARESRRS